MDSITQANCPICLHAGTPLYHGLVDQLYDSEGVWAFKQCDNPACASLWLDPRPHPDHLHEAYRRYHTHVTAQTIPTSDFRRSVQVGYALSRLGYPTPMPWQQRWLNRLVDWMPRRSEGVLYRWVYLPWRPGGRVLEIGCGAGEQLARLRDAGWEATGIEFDEMAAVEARRRGLDVRVGDVRAMALPGAQFDAIVMTHVVEHVEDPVGLLTECRRLLRDDGRLLMVTPNAGALGRRLYADHWRGLEPPRHLQVFTPAAMRLAIGRAGFAVEWLRTSARAAAYSFQASRDADDAQHASPTPGRRAASGVPGSRLLALEAVERIGCRLGLDWGEEIVVSVRPARDRS